MALAIGGAIGVAKSLLSRIRRRLNDASQFYEWGIPA